MSSLRNQDRIRLGILMGLSLLVAVGAYWILQVLQNEDIANAAREASHEPDYIVDNFNFVRTASSGLARYDVSGKRLQHFPDGDFLMIDAPIVKSFAKNRPPMTMTSVTALSNADGSRIQMRESVVIDRPPSEQANAMHLETNYLLLQPDDDVMQTDRPVAMTVGDAHLFGTGMFADNAKREFHVLSKVHGHFPPRGR